jgi:branched-chain amino acid transport system substrate-binding protein
MPYSLVKSSCLLPYLRRTVVTAALVALLGVGAVRAEPKYGPGASDKEIKLGQTAPYSGPASIFSLNAKVELAYFKMLNETQGGINGRKINLISLDDAYSPPKTVEQTRKLVEDDEVLAIVGMVGTLANVAVAKYLNSKKVPQILGTTGTDKLNDPKAYPWTTTFLSSQDVEGRMYAGYILDQMPKARIGVLYQNDDYGKGYYNPFKSEFGARADQMIVKAEPYEISSPTVDSYIVSLKAAGADLVYLAATPKFAAQAIRKIYELAWRPTVITLTSTASISSVFQPAGVEASKGVLTALWRKDVDDPKWSDDPDVVEYRAFMKQWAPEFSLNDGTQGYQTAVIIAEVLKRCGDNLTRENLMTEATNIKGLRLPLNLTGITIDVSPEDRIPWRSARMAKFDGTGWQFVTDLMTIPPRP